MIVDSQSAVAVLERSTRKQAILRGNGGRDLDLEYTDDDTDMKEGDVFITSGLDRIYPKGLPVGSIVSVRPRKGAALFKTIVVRPSGDIGRLEEVMCVVDPPETVDVFDPTERSAAP